jgi:hypothetical protein
VYAAVLQAEHAARKPPDQIEWVAAEDERLQAPRCELAEERFDFTPRIQVHAGRRLIEQHHIGGHRPRARQRQPLLLASGQRACVALGERGQADAGQRLVRLLAGVSPARAAQPQAQWVTLRCAVVRSMYAGTTTFDRVTAGRCTALRWA